MAQATLAVKALADLDSTLGGSSSVAAKTKMVGPLKITVSK